jgi:hypothetical protein
MDETSGLFRQQEFKTVPSIFLSDILGNFYPSVYECIEGANSGSDFKALYTNILAT